MKIITPETLKTMPNGTVFSEINKWGMIDRSILILTGDTKERTCFVKQIGLHPRVDANNGGNMYDMMFDEDANPIIDKNIPTKYGKKDGMVNFFEENQLFAVFSKAEVRKMIKFLQWALSGLEDDFDVDEVLE